MLELELELKLELELEHGKKYGNVLFLKKRTFYPFGRYFCLLTGSLMVNGGYNEVWCMRASYSIALF